MGSENIVFLKIEILFEDSVGLLKIDTPSEITIDNTFYKISIDKTSFQLKIEGIFNRHTYQKTFSKFSELPKEQILCIETETDNNLNVFFDDHYYPAISEVERLYKLLRWKYSLGFGKLKGNSKNAFWSIDKEDWRSIISCPSPENLRVTVIHQKPLDEKLIKDMMENGDTEPVFFELLREANTISHTSLESAFVIAVSALEVAVKYLIKIYIPKAEWLIDESPTPPIERIIREFFPQLISEFKLEKQQSEELKSIILIRNKIVHSGRIGNKRETLFRMMNFINDFIFETLNSRLK